MIKRRLMLAALFLTVAFTASGCKSREKIDLNTLHTSEAQTLAPSKESDAESTEKETESESKETSAADEKESQGQNSSSALSVRSKINTEKDGKVSIEYPVLSNLRDSKMEETVNALIKEKALQIISAYELNPASDTLSVECTIISLDRNKAVLSYEGSLMINGAAHPQALFYTMTVDLNKGTLLGLSDYADPYTMAGYIVSDDCVTVKPEASEEVSEYLKAQDVNTVWETLKQCDFTSGDSESFPQAFSYENLGSIYMAIPVPHALGDYVIVRYDPDTK